MARHFFKWADLKADEERLAHAPHMKFRLITTTFLIMAVALFLMRVSYLSSSSLVLASSLALMLLLTASAVYLIFTTRLIFSKLVLLASVVLFQAVEFGQSPYLNLAPISAPLLAILAANALFVAFLFSIKD
ncbi:MAG: hypothetical protein Q7T16_00705 [Candidatus Burarchaeum sp.]|nr:hypothetical protein [Candidatus Burarchaeum sp.]MDO8339156.1 hypothetical protein [Candidatus Burarchaeum sp.]